MNNKLHHIDSYRKDPITEAVSAVTNKIPSIGKVCSVDYDYLIKDDLICITAEPGYFTGLIDELDNEIITTKDNRVFECVEKRYGFPVSGTFNYYLRSNDKIFIGDFIIKMNQGDKNISNSELFKLLDIDEGISYIKNCIQEECIKRNVSYTIVESKVYSYLIALKINFNERGNTKK